jgi:hypothetical protein
MKKFIIISTLHLQIFFQSTKFYNEIFRIKKLCEFSFFGQSFFCIFKNLFDNMISVDTLYSWIITFFSALILYIFYLDTFYQRNKSNFIFSEKSFSFSENSGDESSSEKEVD